MPMSPRLLRPRASAALVAVDADARAYINAVRIADGGQYMEPAVQLAIDAFVVGCKQDGIWSAIKASCILMGARTLSGALTPLVGAAPTNNGPFVSGDYNRETGLIGDGVGKNIDTNRAGDADPQNNMHLSVYASTRDSGGVYIGSGAGTDAGSSQFGGNGDNVGFRNRNSTNQISTRNFAGFFGASRALEGSFVSRANGSDITSNISSQTPVVKTYRVFARESVAGVVGAFSISRIAFYSIGESLDLALLDTRVSTLYTAIGAAI